MFVRKLPNNAVDIELHEIPEVDDAQAASYRPLTHEEQLALRKYINEFKKKVPTLVDLWVSDAIAVGTISVLFLFPNGVRKFFVVRSGVRNSLKTNLWDWYFIPSVVILAASLDAATVSSEAFSITTPAILLTVATATITLPVLLGRLCIRESKKLATRRLANILGEKSFLGKLSISLSTLSRRQMNNICDFIDGLENRDVQQATIEFIKLKLGLFSVEKTYIDLVKLSDTLEQYGVRNYLIHTMDVRLPSIERFFEWFNEGKTTIDKYVSSAMKLGFIPGIFLWKWMADQLQRDDRWKCPVYPMWAPWSSECTVTERADAMSGITLVWDSMTFAGFSTFEIGMACIFANYFMAKYNVMNSMRSSMRRMDNLYEFWFSDELSWARHELIRKVNQRWGIPIILTVASILSYELLSTYGNAINCSPSDMMRYMLSGDRPGDYTCSTSEISLGISIVVCLYEFFIGYPAYFVLDLFSSFVSAFAVNFTQYKNYSINKSMEAINWLRRLEGIGMAAGGLAVAVSTNAIILNLISFSNQLGDEGVNVIIETNNSTNPGFNPRDFNLTRFDQLDPEHYKVNIHDSCPASQYGILLIFIYNLIGKTVECDWAVVTRQIGAFVAPYWGDSSFSFMNVTEAVILLGLAYYGIQYVINHCDNRHDYQPIEHNPHQFWQRPRGCLDRVKFFFTSAMAEQNSEIIQLDAEKLIPGEQPVGGLEMVEFRR